MGGRAYLFLVDRDGVHVHRSRWAGAFLDRELFWGPEHAERWLRGYEPLSTATGHTDRGVDGGLTLDLVRRTLVLYGGRVGADVLERRLYLRLLRHTWPGWTVQWAADGMATVAARAGLDPHAVLAEPATESVRADWPAREDGGDPPGTPSLVVTIATGSGVGALSSGHHWMCDFALADPDVVLGAGPGAALRVPYPPLNGGLHLDVGQRALSWWVVDVSHDRGLDAPFARHWPGWRRTDLGDRFEDQVALARGALTVEQPDDAEVLARVVEYLTPDPAARKPTIPPAAARRLLADAVAALAPPRPVENDVVVIDKPC